MKTKGDFSASQRLSGENGIFSHLRMPAPQNSVAPHRVAARESGDESPHSKAGCAHKSRRAGTCRQRASFPRRDTGKAGVREWGLGIRGIRPSPNQPPSQTHTPPYRLSVVSDEKMNQTLASKIGNHQSQITNCPIPTPAVTHSPKSVIGKFMPELEPNSPIGGWQGCAVPIVRSPDLRINRSPDRYPPP